VFNGAMLKPTLTAGAVLVALLCAAPASAKIVEVGRTDATPACPDSPCLAVSRTTGYQAKVGETRGLMTAPQDGRIVAWTITLSKPGPSQIKFFEENLGGQAQAGLAILRTGAKLYARTLSVSPVQQLTPFFGKTVQFALVKTLVIHKGETIGLNVPTWAPTLAVGLGGDTSWRASRSTDQCRDTQTQTAQKEGQVTQYRCLYRTARLAYSATMVTRPGT
jgi:hypothetical protein